MLEDIEDRFDKITDQLYESDQYLASEITKLGYPKLTDSIQTAALSWDEEQKKPCFMFGEDFYSSITDEEFKFAVAHEAYHLLCGHIFLFQKEIEKARRKKLKPEKVSAHVKKLNNAADCVINDSLIKRHEFRKVFSNEHDLIKIYYGEDLVGFSCDDLSVMDVYKSIPDVPESFDEHPWESFYEKDGTVKKGFVDFVHDVVDENIDNSFLNDDDINFVDGLKKSMQESTDSYAKNAGDSALGELVTPLIKNHSINWYKIIDALSYKFNDRWNRPYRKLISIYPEVILPTVERADPKNVFIAIDASGSVNKEALGIFLSVVKNTPSNHYNIRAITFDTQCYEYDIKSGKPYGHGGTSFSAIEDWIQDNYSKYPEVVVVFTDGGGNSVKPQYPDRWNWILYNTETTRYCSGMKMYDLEDLL